MTQALLDLWMSQSSQGETQFINRDLSEKMLISEIESKNQGFVDTTAAFHRACAQSRLHHIKVTPHQGYPPSRLPPHTCHPASVQIELTQPGCQAELQVVCRRVAVAHNDPMLQLCSSKSFLCELVTQFWQTCV